MVQLFQNCPKISYGFSPERYFWTYCIYHHNNHHTKAFKHHLRSKNSWQIKKTLIFNQKEINIFQTFISYKKWKSIFSRLWHWWGWHHLKGGIWKWHEWVSSENIKINKVLWKVYRDNDIIGLGKIINNEDKDSCLGWRLFIISTFETFHDFQGRRGLGSWKPEIISTIIPQ